MRWTKTMAALGAACLFAAAPAAGEAEPQTICTAVADAETGEMLISEGTCDLRATSASTFKIAISLMGYDSGFLTDLHHPALPFQEGYADWIPAWRAETDPARWMRESVVWYSQLITTDLGPARFAAYVDEFDYGNEDVSGTPGEDDGLTTSWLSSSLQISPLEQIAFLGRVARRELPVSAEAFEMTETLIDQGEQRGGWHVYGKTGAGLPVDAAGAPVRGNPYGWFVGWATKGDRTVLFARLRQGRAGPDTSPGYATRDSILADLFAAPETF